MVNSKSDILVKIFISLFGFAICGPVQLQPCKVTDGACMISAANAFLPRILAGDPEHGLKSMEPVFVSEIDGNLSVLKFHLVNVSSTGYRNCVISNVKFNVVKMVLRFEAKCRDIHVTGQYSTKGRLIVLPVEGSGDFKINSKEFTMNAKLDVQKSEGSDGNNHLHIKGFSMKAEATDRIVFDFDNIFSGNKELAVTILKFANENWKEVADFVQEPVVNANMKALISGANKFLKTVTYEQLFIE